MFENKETQRLLENIKKAEEHIERVALDPYRLQYHLMPPVGWLNDPNGLCIKDGIYHVFFQYSPTDAKGGMKCWGHYTSKDLVNWNYIGTPILPDCQYDKNGAYSGSALVVGDTMHIFYTGNVKLEGNYDYIYKGRLAPTIRMTTKDGIHFTKKEIVLDNAQYPSGYSCHIRDPKVWEDNGYYYMVLGARTNDDEGQVLVYRSLDLQTWSYTNVVKTKERFGYMWECPDYFAVKGQKFLSISPQGLVKYSMRHQNIYQSGYFLLEGNIEDNYELSSFEEWDYGFDFYAPQSFEDDKGRRILVGWMGLPDIEDQYYNPTVERGWQHCFTMFREITVENGIVKQYPVEEYKKIRGTSSTITSQRKQQTTKSYEAMLQNHSNESFYIEINGGVILKWDKEEALVNLTFTDMTGANRLSRNVKIKTCKTITIFVDTSAIEIYLNEGEKVLSTRFYPQEESSIQIQGDTIGGIMYELLPLHVDFTKHKDDESLE